MASETNMDDTTATTTAESSSDCNAVEVSSIVSETGSSEESTTSSSSSTTTTTTTPSIIPESNSQPPPNLDNNIPSVSVVSNVASPEKEKESKKGEDIDEEISKYKGEAVWETVLKEVSHSVSTTEKTSLLILGDKNCGKSTLVTKLLGVDVDEFLEKGFALSYTFMEPDEGEDDSKNNRIHIWQMEGEVEHSDLLKFAISKDSISTSLCMIALDCSRPWDLPSSLEKWLAVLENHIQKLNIDKQELEGHKKQLHSLFQHYSEPSVDTSQQQQNTVRGHQFGALKKPSTEDLLPLGEDVLAKNLGIPIVVVCCKSDCIEKFILEHKYVDGHFDFIQQHLRHICLKYGAGLIFTSAKKDKNCQVLLDYIYHSLLCMPLTHRCQLVDKDEIFVPMGWDSLAKIRLDFDNLPKNLVKEFDEPYQDVISPLDSSMGNNQNKEDDEFIEAEDDQKFLAQYKELIEQETATVKDDHQDTGSSGILSQFKKFVPQQSQGTPSDSVSPDESSQKAPGMVARKFSKSKLNIKDELLTKEPDQKVLANFFSSLMKKENRPIARKDEK